MHGVSMQERVFILVYNGSCNILVALVFLSFNNMLGKASLVWIVVLVSSSCWTVQGSNNCAVTCEPNGSCREDGGECDCNPGFAGADCSFPYETCPDGVITCFDGAECTRLSTRLSDGTLSQYQCDCTTIPDASPFQIDQCEAPDSEACIAGTSSSPVFVSDYAFCTNGGKCIKKVQAGEPHAGCRCPSDFEGRHCQYRKGTAPLAELKISLAENEHHVEGVLLFFIILIVGGVLGGFACIIYGRMKSSSWNTTMQDIEDSTKDLQLDTIDMEEPPKGEMT